MEHSCTIHKIFIIKIKNYTGNMCSLYKRRIIKPNLEVHEKSPSKAKDIYKLPNEVFYCKF